MVVKSPSATPRPPALTPTTKMLRSLVHGDDAEAPPPSPQVAPKQQQEQQQGGGGEGEGAGDDASSLLLLGRAQGEVDEMVRAFQRAATDAAFKRQEGRRRAARLGADRALLLEEQVRFGLAGVVCMWRHDRRTYI